MLYFNNTEIKNQVKQVKGEFVTIENERYYKITNVDQMPPFLMTITSASNHWMFISSNGGLTCGRRSNQHALFPYTSDDKIHDSCFTTGPKTIIRLKENDKIMLWIPFNSSAPSIYNIERNIYKNRSGNKIIFEEINHDLKLQFRYQWLTSNKYGFIKKTGILNLDTSELKGIELVDGLINILPPDVNPNMQATMSTLVDAYKVARIVNHHGLGLYLLSSAISDRAEALESLKANVVYTLGIVASHYFLSLNMMNNFLKGMPVEDETESKGQRGNYFLHAQFEVETGGQKEWVLVADVEQSHAKINNLTSAINQSEMYLKKILADIQKGDEQLQLFVAKADGLQKTSDEIDTTRHYSNVLFNIMRGGFFPENYTLYKTDLMQFFHTRNVYVQQQFSTKLDTLPDQLVVNDLVKLADHINHPDFIRLVYEYLPLTFSRRHGDPSRPWNKFDINIGDPENRMHIDYQGNWRDIFQNWEALLYSYPVFIEHVVSKFLNASTIDGYNPYRITSAGIDWETFDPDDPWSNIGYWGDHQIIYLLRLLEMFDAHFPQRLTWLLSAKQFVYANVPYRVKEFNDILKDPFNTIVYSDEMEKMIDKRVSKFGSDGKLVFKNKKQLMYAGMIEKLLLPLLTKLSNFVPDAGIWMNNQRPEWNDANNALVGNGASMVTLYYMRRYTSFVKNLIKKSDATEYLVQFCLFNFLNDILQVLNEFRDQLKNKFSDALRFKFVSALGDTGSRYRQSVYKEFVTDEMKKVSTQQLFEFLEVTIEYIDKSIESNLRKDGLFHAYNLLEIKKESIQVHFLHEMLEGQVALLSSGYLNAKQVIDLTKNIRNSKLYRQDQDSYMLYPDEELTFFLDKNNLSEHVINSNPLLEKLAVENDISIIEKDTDGMYHFSSPIKNAQDLTIVLHSLEKKVYKTLVDNGKSDILKKFESIFNHRSFTGRSGRFFKYEGIGSIYWHMVSKYALAVIEQTTFTEDSEDNKIIFEQYSAIKAGIGIHKTPEQYGAFPTDPYSHTPSFAGVQQPGMTGQVKEDIIARWKELGIKISNGQITFNPPQGLLNEFIKGEHVYKWYDLVGRFQDVKVSGTTLFFTYCQVPIIYQINKQPEIQVFMLNDKIHHIQSDTLPEDISQSIFNRSNLVRMIQVCI